MILIGMPHRGANPNAYLQSNLLLRPPVWSVTLSLAAILEPPRMILNANAPLLRMYLSNTASGRQNWPTNTEIVSLNGQFLCVDVASFN